MHHCIQSILFNHQSINYHIIIIIFNSSEKKANMIAFESSDHSQILLSGAGFVEILKCLGVENLLYAMFLTLLEQKVF